LIQIIPLSLTIRQNKFIIAGFVQLNYRTDIFRTEHIMIFTKEFPIKEEQHIITAASGTI